MGFRNGHLKSAYVPLMCHFCCELQVKPKKRQGTSSPDLPSAHSTGCHSQLTVNGSHILHARSHCTVGPPLKQRLKVVIYLCSACSSVPPTLFNILHKASLVFLQRRYWRHTIVISLSFPWKILCLWCSLFYLSFSEQTECENAETQTKMGRSMLNSCRLCE